MKNLILAAFFMLSADAWAATKDTQNTGDLCEVQLDSTTASGPSILDAAIAVTNQDKIVDALIAASELAATEGTTQTLLMGQRRLNARRALAGLQAENAKTNAPGDSAVEFYNEQNKRGVSAEERDSEFFERWVLVAKKRDLSVDEFLLKLTHTFFQNWLKDPDQIPSHSYQQDYHSYLQLFYAYYEYIKERSPPEEFGSWSQWYLDKIVFRFIRQNFSVSIELGLAKAFREVPASEFKNSMKDFFRDELFKTDPSWIKPFND